MTDTDFVDIIGYENKYQINRNGDVRRKGSEGFLARCSDGNNGYSLTYLYTLDGDNTRTQYKNHRLVALQFLPNPENKTEVDHIDRNRQNNHVSNLRWATHKENAYNKGNNIVLAEGQTMLDYKHDQVNNNRLKHNDRFKASDNAYYEANKEHIQEKRKEIFMKNEAENKELARIRAAENYAKRREELLAKIDCPCGGKYTLHSKAKHFKTQIHIDFTATQ
jgi:prophage tail gpP-like protein